jgi:hypothetical protein
MENEYQSMEGLESAPEDDMGESFQKNLKKNESLVVQINIIYSR